MQYGQAMHVALKAYFDGVSKGRPPVEEAVIACFLDEFRKAKIGEEEQRRRYEKDGAEQLTRLLRSPLAQPGGEIIANEKSFTVHIDDITVKGRIDRLERMAGNQVRVDRLQDRPREICKTTPETACSWAFTRWRRARTGWMRRRWPSST